ncbi:MAG: NAD-dependent epimerase/dehydratase family protein [Sphingobacteriales bacterium]|jgi:dihydroflavonol-4-reductase|nr:NAD-dependent epimerase/dehydratase family protein [Sphingobacteriales bacterium]MBP9141316.1 NAD-dependent epimerase/dehydratase family protein [Chitinophagales bacterium]MDA0197807.1 NAD-dependent epimerase/dehydratase family protein [Bacteroidota bacterium]MBK7528600.1 NAD-dependent epimerase/dehydratase family protein [Sphingobacteriales bacterium]MBK8679438.1 NAD-dependent epimerase/dehydratase family protein [Sphingobacteriales bacterium]
MIFVTGGTGLIGANLLALLNAQPNSLPIVALARDPKKVPGHLLQLSNVKWVEGDILDTECLFNAMRGAKQVYHVGAFVSLARRDRPQMFQINVTGTANVVNAALENGVERMLHVSSIAALGIPKDGNQITEAFDGDLERPTWYAHTKLQGELEVWRGIAEGLNAVIVNPCMVLGSNGSDFDRSSPLLFRQTWEGVPFYPKGGTGFIDVRDVANLMLLLMQSTIVGERYILSAENLSYRHILSLIAQVYGKKPSNRPLTPLLEQLAWRAEGIKSFLTGRAPTLTRETLATTSKNRPCDNSKIKAAFPAFNFTPINETIERVCNEFLTINKLKI